MTGCYLLHFEAPIAPGLHTAQHYLGWAEDIDRRLDEHRRGRGARLCEVAAERGIGFVLARVWSRACRKTERRLKRRKEGPRLCPICREGR